MRVSHLRRSIQSLSQHSPSTTSYSSSAPATSSSSVPGNFGNNQLKGSFTKKIPKKIGILDADPDPKPTAAERAAQRQIDEAEAGFKKLFEDLPKTSVKEDDVRIQNSITSNGPHNKSDQFSQPHNFTSLRDVSESGFTPLDKAVRDYPWESRFDLMKRAVKPVYTSPVPGTPVRQNLEGVVDGMRVRPVFNKNVKLTRAKRYRLDNWPSRDWGNVSHADKKNSSGNDNISSNNEIDPISQFLPKTSTAKLRGGRKAYNIPEDLNPEKDELGELHPPKVSGRYRADIEKQFYAFSLPWVWGPKFFDKPNQKADRYPNTPTRWRKKELTRLRVAEAMRSMPKLVEEFRKERREARRLTWFEHMTKEFLGDSVVGNLIRKRKVPKL